MPKVYISCKIRDNGISLLRSKGYLLEVNGQDHDLSKDELKKAFSSYNAVLTTVTDKIDKEIIEAASKNLKIISNYAVGFDNIDIKAASEKGITVTNTPGVANQSVAEHTFALILALSKQLKSTDKFVSSGQYTKWDPNAFLRPQVCGQTIGIIGLGGIGMLVGQIAYNGFKMEIIYFDIRRAEDFELITDARSVSLEEVAKKADIVSLHVPLTPTTDHLIGMRELKRMKKSAILINTSRGRVVDEEALVWALKEGEIAAAGLDVFEHEPNVSSELIKMDNVIVTPHIASSTIETREKMSEVAALNIIDVFEGREPVGLIKQ